MKLLLVAGAFRILGGALGTWWPAVATAAIVAAAAITWRTRSRVVRPHADRCRDRQGYRADGTGTALMHPEDWG